MKTVIIGGSAQSTPALFDLEVPFAAGRFSFALIGRSMRRLAAVKRAIDTIGVARETRIDCAIAQRERLAAELVDADVVVVQFRIGGYAARQWDETFPHRYDLCGDEGLGVGGLAAAWRTWDALHDVLATVARVRPGAMVILLTSPIGILTRCSRDAFPNLQIYGICELPWTTLGELCRQVQLDVSQAAYAYLAVNHIGWFAHLGAPARKRETVDTLHPLKYVRLNDAPHDVLYEQRRTRPRALELEALAEHAFGAYEEAGAAEIFAAIRRRSTPWYAHAVGPLLHGLVGAKTDTTFFLTTQNVGYEPRLGAGEFIEIPHVLDAGTLRRRAPLPWTDGVVAERIGRLVAYERSAAAAVRSRDTAGLAAALRLHPWLDGAAVGAQLLSDVVRDVRSPASVSN
jgi:alpha-galactosidase/6-phospho-beta-glucosidase family protein